MADTALRRKLGDGRVGRSPIRDVEKLAESFAKLLDERLRHLLRAYSASIVEFCEAGKLSQVLERAATPSMLGIVDVAGAGDRVMVYISGELLFHIVDLRMGGDPAEAPSPIARGITGVDCALCAGVVDLAIAAFEEALTAGLGVEDRRAMSLSHFEQHPGMVRIAPDHADVLRLRLALDLGEAARGGALEIAAPLSVLDLYKVSGEQAARRGREASRSLWARRMARVAADAPVRLNGVLHRAEMSVSEIAALAPGDVVPLPERCRGEVELRLSGPEDEAALASGRLGAADGMKAVKLTAAPDPDLTRRIKALIGTEGP